ncbi:MAG: DUF5915 domain-containing protein [Anaerolineaceae bacterium]
MLDLYADILEDELNVKQVRALDVAGEAVSYNINPLPKQLGQKYGSKFPGIRKAILELNPDEAAAKFMMGENVSVSVNGESYEILPEEVEVRANAKEGFAVAVEGDYLAALVTDLTPELVYEGMAREFVRRVQDLRKQSDFDIADRIKLYYSASPELTKAINQFSEYIQNETLTVELIQQEPPKNLPFITDNFDGEAVGIGIERKF